MFIIIVPLQFDTVADCVEISNVMLKSYTVYTEVRDCELVWVPFYACLFGLCMHALCVCNKITAGSCKGKTCRTVCRFILIQCWLHFVNATNKIWLKFSDHEARVHTSATKNCAVLYLNLMFCFRAQAELVLCVCFVFVDAWTVIHRANPCWVAPSIDCPYYDTDH